MGALTTSRSFVTSSLLPSRHLLRGEISERSSTLLVPQAFSMLFSIEDRSTSDPASENASARPQPSSSKFYPKTRSVDAVGFQHYFSCSSTLGRCCIRALSISSSRLSGALPSGGQHQTFGTAYWASPTHTLSYDLPFSGLGAPAPSIQ